MKKDFDSWNELKKSIHTEGGDKFYHARDIWWCSLGINIGTESDGKGDDYSRPILILKGFNKNSFLGISLTGREGRGNIIYTLER